MSKKKDKKKEKRQAKAEAQAASPLHLVDQRQPRNPRPR